MVSHLTRQIDLFPGSCLILDPRKNSIFSGIRGCDWVQRCHQQMWFRGPQGEHWRSCVSRASGQICDMLTLGHEECCFHVCQVHGTLLTLNPAAPPVPLFLNWLNLPLMREAEGVRCSLCHPPRSSVWSWTRVWLVRCNGKSVSRKGFLPWLREWGHWERGPTSPDKKKRGRDTPLHSSCLWILTWEDGTVAAAVNILGQKDIPDEDARLGRRKAPESSNNCWATEITLGLPSFRFSTGEKKINLWRYLLLLVVHVLFSTSGHSTSSPKHGSMAGTKWDWKCCRPCPVTPQHPSLQW